LARGARPGRGRRYPRVASRVGRSPTKACHPARHREGGGDADALGTIESRLTPSISTRSTKIVEHEGGTVERFLAVIGPWEYFGIFGYPDLETAFGLLGKIAKLEVFETETLPAEEVKLFWKAFV
jgi:hypothetical protein